MVTVRVSETYDLSTKVGKMGMVGIHTPTGPLVERMWSGLVRQYGKFRYSKCDVTMACASMLPADPLQIGVEAGAIAPQDMFNPILYKAVSNDSMNNFLSLMKYKGFASPNSIQGANVNAGSVVAENNEDFKKSDGTTSVDQFDMYYGLLADSDGWRKAMPQAGLQMRNLVPLVYEVLTNSGINGAWGPGVTGAPSSGLNGGKFYGGNVYQSNSNTQDTDPGENMLQPTSNLVGVMANGFTRFKGKSKPMPWINTKFWTAASGDSIDANYDGTLVSKTEADNKWANLQSNVGRAPPCYVGLIILPPAVLNQLYYRIKITWSIEFTDLQSNAELLNWFGVSQLGDMSYYTDYAEQSEAMATTEAMVDTSGADLTKIMESA